MPEITESGRPWRAEENIPVMRADDCIFGFQIWGPNCRIAFTEQQNIGPENEAANARLIAAAPELLDACMAVHFLLSHETEEAMEGDDNLSGAFNLVRDAITKATGVDPGSAGACVVETSPEANAK